MSHVRVSANVATHWEGETAYVGLLPAGPLVSFSGGGALIWSLLLEAGAETIVERTAAAAELPAEAVRGDVLAFVTQCADLGLLEPAD